MADHDNPFGGDDERTVFVPSPGGGRRRQRDASPSPPPEPRRDPTLAAPPGRARDHSRATASPSPAPPSRGTSAVAAFRTTGINALVDAAMSLLALGSQLRHTTAPQDIEALRKQIGRAIQKFETDAREHGASREATMMARYAVCTFVDEMVLSTPWGSESGWGQNSMLSTFHKETWGGEKFFTLVDRLVASPGGNLDVLELLYICICLGFEGKYRVLDRGRMQIQAIEEKVYRIIADYRGDFERELAPHWRGLEDRRSALTRFVPLWVIGAFAAAVLLALYVTFTFSLTHNADPVFNRIMAIGGKPPPRIEQAPTQSSLGMREFLAPEIAERQVEVIEYEDRTIILIKGDGLFASGSVVPRAEIVPLLRRIAEAIVPEPGHVLVTGHTDNVPIRTLKFPSNWHLSQARADAVADMLADFIPPEVTKVISAEGRADSEALVSNDTAEHRARNRRVEIVLRGRGVDGTAVSANP